MIHQINSSRNVFSLILMGQISLKEGSKMDISLTLFTFGHFSPYILHVRSNKRVKLGITGNLFEAKEIKVMGHYYSHISDIAPRK